MHAITAQLICAFVFALAKTRFSRDVALLRMALFVDMIACLFDTSSIIGEPVFAVSDCVLQELELGCI